MYFLKGNPVPKCHWALALSLMWFMSSAQAAEINVAVASNFVNPAKIIAAQFTDATTQVVNISSGSTGKLYSQITNGAPFDVFLAANAREPERLETEGNAVAGSRFTYAVGKLVLWSAAANRVQGDCEAVLRKMDYTKLAIANPDTAPYGRQAANALESLALYSRLGKKLIIGSNIGQTFQFVSSHNVELGIVSLSQVIDPNNRNPGSYCLIPDELYQPLVQQAVLLQHGAGNDTAREFLAYLQSRKVHDLILGYGYGLPTIEQASEHVR